MFKKITVKPHLREGKPVSGHDRTITNGADPADQAAAAAGAAVGVLGLAEATGEPVTVLVDRKGKRVSTKSYELLDLDLSGYDLRNVDFSGLQKMENVNFSGAVLDGVKISDVGMKGCNFDGASLKGTNITIAAKMSDCSFRGARLDDAVINAGSFNRSKETNVSERCDFGEASLQNTTIVAIDFSEASFAGALLSGAKINRVWFMEGSSFRNVTIKDSELDNVELWDVDLTGGTIENCKINQSKISLASVEKIKKLFSSKEAKTAKAPGLTIKDTVFTGVKLAKSDLSGVTIQNVKIDESVLEKVTLTGASLSEVKIYNTSFNSCDGRNGNYTKTSFTGSTFYENDERSDFSGSDFSGTGFSDVTLGNTNVKGSKWAGAEVKDLAIFPDAQNLSIVSAPDLATKDQSQNSYEHYSFADAAAAKGYSDKQIEFLIVSGAIEVRNNQSKLRQKADFDPSSQHIPVWSFQNLPDVK